MKNLNLQWILVFLVFFVSSTFCQTEVIPFDSDKWNLLGAENTEFLGRKCLKGMATLKDASFENGVIEVDMAVTGERSYPGILFRMTGENEYERIYIRPHLPKVFQNVIQYEGTFNGLDSWQLYYGPGKTTSAVIPVDKWFHVKIEVNKNQARLFIDDSAEPVLFITDLAHGISKGTIGVMGPNDGSAYFSNFSYTVKNDLSFPETKPAPLPFGMITDWELSQPKKINDVDMEVLPEAQGIKDLLWQKIKSQPSGLVDISRYYGRLSQSPDIIWAKKIINADKDETRQYTFGYSDYIYIFLNGKLLFGGNSAYTSRDANFQGIVGLNDYIFLPLKKGKNELVIAVVETFGGWGFMFQDVDAVYEHPDLSKQWEIKNKFKYPESAVYDRKRDVIYVSNYTGESNGFISVVNTKGEMEKPDWITGILQPTGLCIYNDKLYVVGRYNLIEIDLEKGQVSNRFQIPSPAFPNDIASDGNGAFYITDSRKNVIYKLENGTISEWLNSGELSQSNGIIVDKDKIIVGTSADGSIKSIDINTKEIKNIFSLEPGTVMDGLACDGKGNYLITDHAGRLFRVTPSGSGELLLNTTARPITLADFDYVPEKGLLIIPTLADNRLMMYKIK
ncbi:MAG: SMP-30/gluconolactonase/LRE family protein [bacterium]